MSVPETIPLKYIPDLTAEVYDFTEEIIFKRFLKN